MTISKISEGSVLPTDSNIQYFGRWDKSQNSIYKSCWAGAYIKVRFTGSTIKIKLQKRVNFFANIDGKEEILYISGNGTVNLTPNPLSKGMHTLRITARYDEDEIQFCGFILDSGETTLASDEKKDIIEFIGDSITSGHSTTNFAISDYAWIASESLNCEHTQISHSGITLVEGYGWNEGVHSQSVQYFKTTNLNYNDSEDWDFTKYCPKLIVINIGTNDAWLNVPADIFENTYLTFLSNVRDKHPNAHIFALVPFGGYFSDEIMGSVKKRNIKGDLKLYCVDTKGWLLPEDYVEDGGHPNDGGHIKVAELLSPILKQYL